MPQQVRNSPRLREQHSCDLCSATFRRRENLQRHRQGHSKARPFRCDECGKSFHRRDTLQRHLMLHDEAPARERKTPRRVARACIHCVQSKQRCSGSRPCERCTQKFLDCSFPETPGHGSSSSHDASDQPEVYEEIEVGGDPTRPQRVPSTSVDLINHRDTVAPVTFSDPEEAPILQAEFGSMLEPFLWPLYNNDMAYYNMAPQYDASDILETNLLTPCDNFGDTPGGDESSAPSPAPRLDVSSSDRRRRRGSPLEIATPLSTSLVSSGREIENPIQETTAIDAEIEERDILVSEDFRHISPLSASSYQELREFCSSLFKGLGNVQGPCLPSMEILNVFAQLYFEYFHKGFPLLHQATFEVRKSSPLLYLAVAATGSQYSRLSDRGEYRTSLLKIIRWGLLSKLELGDLLQNNLQLTQTMLLFNYVTIFNGNRDEIIRLQHLRNSLVTMCRPLLFPGLLFKQRALDPGPVTTMEDWSRWITIESWSRVVYFAWLTECFQLVIFDLPPLISVSDLHLSMPCHHELWQCRTPSEWQAKTLSHKGRQQTFSVLDLLRRDKLDLDAIEVQGESTPLLTIFAFYANERCTLRQLGCYTNSSGLDEFQGHTSTVSNKKAPSPAELRQKNTESVLRHFAKTSIYHVLASALHDTAIKVAHVLTILRFIPYRLMYVASGWLTDSKGAEQAGRRICQILKAKPSNARECLMHAARLFRIIRNQRQLDEYDSFFLVIATLYISSYDRYVVDVKSRPATGTTTPSQVVRIDQETDRNSQENLLNGDVDIHITGVGVLDGRDSVLRIMRESASILSHDKAWSEQAYNMELVLRHIVSGEASSNSY